MRLPIWIKMAVVLCASLGLAAVAIRASSASITYASQLRRYPYLTDVVNSYATVNWGTVQSLSTGAVRWGKAGSESCTAHYAPASRTVVNVNGVPEYQWKATLNLVPDAPYCYRVYLGSTAATEIDLLGSDASPTFRTQVPAGSAEPYTFVVFGDWGYVDSRGTNPYQANLASRIASSGARFALTTGDNSYPSGSQTNYGDLVQSGSGTSAVFGPSFWKMPGSFVPIFAASGNHGISNADPSHPLILNFPEARAVASSQGRYVRDTYCCLDGTSSANYPSAWYAIDAGLARIYVLDSAWADTNAGTASAYQVDHDYKWTANSPEYQWLRADLASHPSVLKFAVFHFPVYSDDVAQLSDTWLQGSDSLEGLLHQYGVDVAFDGHAHIYERNLPTSVGLINYVTGGGGAPLGGLGTCSPLDAYAIISFGSSGKSCGSAPVPTSPAQVYHFIRVTVNGTHVTVAPTDSQGDQFDVQSYDFSAGSDSLAPTVPGKLSASAAGGTQINLNWSASSDDTAVRGYDVYRNGMLISTTQAPTLSYSDTALTPATTYTYTVDAFDGSGNHSAQSARASATTASTATYIFTPVADAYVSSSNAGTNYGLSAALNADASPDVHGYLRFHVADVVGTITKATLKLYSSSSSSTGYQVRSLTSSAWEENLINYANAPALGPVAVSSGSFSSGAWVSPDVTSLIPGNGTFDLAVTTSSTTAMSFRSRDASANWPQLVIQTGGPPGFSANPASLNYSLIKVGLTATARIITVTNTGGLALSIGTVSLTGTNPGQFHLTADSCSNATLPQGGTCTVAADFAPTSLGLKTASITFLDNAGGPHGVALSGRGAAEKAINGGFNQYPSATAMIPSSWTAANFAALDGKDTTVVEEGTASVKISNTSAVQKTLTQTLSLSGAASDALKVSVWGMGQSIPSTAGQVQALVKLYNGTALVQTKTIPFPNGTYGFTQMSLSFSAGGTYNKVVIQLVYSKSSGSVWFDELSLLRSP